jgi:hypothetical protein
METTRMEGTSQSTHIETWAAVKGFEGLYEVSSAGHVRKLKSRYSARRGPRTLKSFSVHGYLYVRLYKGGEGYSIHLGRLILETFAPCPNMHALTVAYKNSSPMDVTLSNLTWRTRAFVMTLNAMNKPGRPSILTAEDVAMIHTLNKAGVSQHAIAARYGIAQGYVSQILRGLRKAPAEKTALTLE